MSLSEEHTTTPSPTERPHLRKTSRVRRPRSTRHGPFLHRISQVDRPSTEHTRRLRSNEHADYMEGRRNSTQRNLAHIPTSSALRGRIRRVSRFGITPKKKAPQKAARVLLPKKFPGGREQAATLNQRTAATLSDVGRELIHRKAPNTQVPKLPNNPPLTART